MKSKTYQHLLAEWRREQKLRIAENKAVKKSALAIAASCDRQIKLYQRLVAESFPKKKMVSTKA